MYLDELESTFGLRWLVDGQFPEPSGRSINEPIHRFFKASPSALVRDAVLSSPLDENSFFSFKVRRGDGDGDGGKRAWSLTK